MHIQSFNSMTSQQMLKHDIIKSYDISFNPRESTEIVINTKMRTFVSAMVDAIKIPVEFTYKELEHENRRVSNNLYGLDANKIPIRKEVSGKGPFGWREINGKKYNINTPNHLLPGACNTFAATDENVFETIVSNIHRLHPATTSTKCAMYRLIEIARKLI